MDLEPCPCPAGPCEHFAHDCRGRWLAYRQGTSGLPRRRELALLAVLAARSGPACRHLGPPTGELRSCPGCSGHVLVRVRRCALHQGCTEAKVIEGLACCGTCPDRAAA